MDWADKIGFAVTVCDIDGVVIYRNDKSAETFAKYGELLGKNLFECHSESSRKKIEKMMDTGEPNTYTVEKAGVKKLIHQTPYIKEGKIEGLVEISIELPETMPHHKRD